MDGPLKIRKISNQTLSRRDLDTSHRKHQLMVISHFITQSQEVGLVSKFQEEDSRDLTQVLMTNLFLPRKTLRTFNKLIMFHIKHQSTATSQLTIPFQQVGPVSRFQVENLRDLIQV